MIWRVPVSHSHIDPLVALVAYPAVFQTSAARGIATWGRTRSRAKAKSPVVRRLKDGRVMAESGI